MSENSKQPGVLFYHLNGKFSLANSEGNVVSKFKYDKNQVVAFQDYLVGGNFEGMFDILTPDDYKLVLGMHYGKMFADTPNKEKRSLLNEEYERKLKEIDNFFEQSSQSQPE